ncbi:MAG TPA: hypothetical protein VL769_12255 [Acidimicrobiia bacterium]|nr:hypothetical protein [Acidimicrobiia bacterium]
MTDRTPLSPEAVDALLSADLDGDLEAAARDLGLDARAARSRLAETPGVEARRVALTRARDLLASRPPLEGARADRLVSAAIAPGEMAIARARRNRNERRWRVLVAAGSVAAAVAIVVGIASLASTDKNVSSKSSGALSSRTTTPQEAATPVPNAAAESAPDFGDVTKAEALRAPAQRLLRLQANRDTVTSQKRAASAPEATGTLSPPVAEGDTNRFAAADGGPACTIAKLRSYDITVRPALIARGTVAGSPVTILIYDGSGHPFAYVIRVSDCSLVRKQSLG